MANNIKILIVDDRPENLHFLSDILVRAGYKVQRAISGQLAINAALASPPDLILLDVVMPNMNGYDVCRHLKENQITKDVPIIFLSVIDEVSEKVKAFNLGAFDYITKPLQAEEVLARVENQLAIKKLQTQLKQQNQKLQKVASELSNRNQQQKSREGYLRALVRIQRMLLGFNGSTDYYSQIVKSLGIASKATCVSIVENNSVQAVRWCTKNGEILANSRWGPIFPRWQDLLTKCNFICSLVADLPEEERLILEQNGTQAILIVPILFRGDFFGFIRFENCSDAKIWSDEEIAFLQAAASAISLAKERLQAEVTLEQELHRSQLLQEKEKKARVRLQEEINKRKQVQQALVTSACKLRQNNLVLTELARNPAIYNGDLAAALKMITVAAAQNVQVERASIWLYEENSAVMRCISLFELSRNRHVEGMSMRVADYPLYFQALNGDEIIATNNPFLDKRTQGLREACLEPFNITSLFSLPVSLAGVTAGMLCLEAVEKAHNWTQEDLNFGRSLGNLISLTLEARSRQIAEAARRLSEQKLAAAFRFSPDLIILSTFPELKCIEVNDSFCEFFGYTREEVIGFSIKGLNIWHDLEQCDGLVELLAKSGAIRNKEVDFYAALGEVRTTLLSAELIEINGQQYVLATARDITERKQALLETRLLLSATQAISRAIDINSAFNFILRLICEHIKWDFGEAWIPSSDGRVLDYCLGWYGNQNGLDEFCRYSETITFSKGLGVPGIVWESKQPQWLEDISQIQTRFIRKEIALKVGLKSCFAVPILNGDEVLAVLMIFKCSTNSRDKRLLELVSAVASQLGELIKRKQAQSAHRHSEERLQLALEASDLGLWDWNIRNSKVYRDSRWKKMLGYEESEIGGDALNLRRLVHPEDWDFIQQELKAYLQGKRPIYEVEFRMRCKNQEWKWIQSRGQIFERDYNGLPLRMTGTHKDITSRKQAQNILQESERRFRAIFDSSFGFTALLKPNGTIISVNQTTLDFFGVETSEVVDLPFWESFGRQICAGIDNFQAKIERARAGEFIRSEVDVIEKNCQIATIDCSFTPIFDENNQVVLLIVEGRDITQSKTLEKELALREARLNAFFSSATVGLATVDRQLRFIQINELLAEINGVSVKEHLGKTVREILPHIAPTVEPFYQQVLATNQPILNIELSGTSITQPDVMRDFLVSYFPIPGENNIPVGVGTVLIEITALKRAETALREREEAFRAIFENAAVGIAQVSGDGTFINVNQQICQILGYSKSQLLQLKCGEITHPDSLAEYLDYCNLLATNQIDVFSMEKAFLRENNEVIWTNLTASVIRKTSGEIKYVIGVVEDISVRKYAEQQMRLATERLQYLIGNSPAVIFSCLPSGNFSTTFISENVYEITGYQAQQFLSDSSFWLHRLHPEDRPKIKKQLSDRQECATFEYRFLHGDGTYHWLYEQIRLIRDEKGYPIEYVGYWVDITERKQTELELQLSQRRYQNLD